MTSGYFPGPYGSPFDDFFARYMGGPRQPRQRIDITQFLSEQARELVNAAARRAAETGSADLDTDHLLWAMTEDDSIDDYEERKAAHRARVAHQDDRVAAIFAADKLAKTRELSRRGERPASSKLDHYLESLRMLRQSHPGIPVLDDLERALHGFLSGVAR